MIINETDMGRVVAHLVNDLGYFITIEHFLGSKYQIDDEKLLKRRNPASYRITAGVAAETAPGKLEQEQQVIWLSENEFDMLR